MSYNKLQYNKEQCVQVIRRQGSAATVAYVEYICISGRTYELTESDSDTDETGSNYLRIPWTAED